MKVVHIIEEYIPSLGGGPIATHRRAKELKKLGVDNVVITGNIINSWTGDKIEAKVEEIDGIEVVRLPTISIHPYFPVVRGIRKVLKNIDADIVHLYGYGYYITEVAAYILKDSKIPIVFSPGGYFPATKDINKYLVRSFEFISKRNSLRYASRIFVETEYDRSIYSNLANPNKIRIIPVPTLYENAIRDDYNPNIFKKEYGISEEYFIAMGRINASKGFQNIIKALPNFIKMSGKSDFKLVIAGADQGYSDELVKLSLRLGIKDKVIIIKNFPENIKFHALTGAIAFILPSFLETYGNVLSEAMAVGTPVITTKYGGTSERVTSDAIGKKIDPTNVEEMSSSMLWAMNLSSTERSIIKQKYREILLNGHTVESSAKLALNEYRIILDGK